MAKGKRIKATSKEVNRYLVAFLFIAMAMVILGVASYLTTVIPNISIPVGYIVVDNNPKYTVITSTYATVSGWYSGDTVIGLDNYYTSPSSDSGKVWLLVFNFTAEPGGYFNINYFEVLGDNVVQATFPYNDFNNTHLVFWGQIPPGVSFNQVGINRKWTMTGGDAYIYIYEVDNTTDPNVLLNYIYFGVSYETEQPITVDSNLFINILSFGASVVLMIVAVNKLGVKI
jgi:hypothetical protein